MSGHRITDAHYGNVANVHLHHSEPLFEDPPNTLFHHPRSATELLSQHTLGLLPVTGSFTPVNYYTSNRPAQEASGWRDVSTPPNMTVGPGFSDPWGSNHGTKCTGTTHKLYPNPPSPASSYDSPDSPNTVFQGMIPHPGPLQSLDVHRQSPLSQPAVTHPSVNHPSINRTERAERRISSSRVAPYPHHASRQSFSNGSGMSQKKQTDSENDSQNRKSGARLASKTHNTDWSKLTPGRNHVIISNKARVSYPVATTAQDFEELGISATVVTYAPRAPEYSSSDHKLKVDFSERGIPGPFLKHLINMEVKLDGAEDKVFATTGWRTTRICIDWPGLLPQVAVINFNKSQLSRVELAHIVAKKFVDIIRSVRDPRNKIPYSPGRDLGVWDLRDINPKHLRLISLNYYQNQNNKVWVPVLALDLNK